MHSCLLCYPEGTQCIDNADDRNVLKKSGEMAELFQTG